MSKEDTLKKVFAIAIQKFMPVSGNVERITLAYCCPYKELE